MNGLPDSDINLISVRYLPAMILFFRIMGVHYIPMGHPASAIAVALSYSIVMGWTCGIEMAYSLKAETPWCPKTIITMNRAIV
jgi:TM2 domain-containing membrane protein YozV